MTAEPSDEAPLDAALTRDWITLVHSELAALAVDREAQETLHALLKIWAGASGAIALAFSDERAGGRPSADVAPRAAPVAAASGAGEPEIEPLTSRIAQRITGLEARIAELERDAGGRDAQRRKRGRSAPESSVGRPAAGDKAAG